MRQGCLVCGEWVSTGLGHSLVMRGVLTDGLGSGRVLVADTVEGLICSDCRSPDGNVISTRAMNELRAQLEQAQTELESCREVAESCRETIESLQGEIVRLKAAPTRIAQDELPVEIVLR